MVMVVMVMVVMVMVVMVIVPCGNGICSLLKGISTAPLSFGFPPRFESHDDENDNIFLNSHLWYSVEE